MAAKVDVKKCTGCEQCISACPLEIIVIKKGKASVGDGCAECGACIGACPSGAISL